MRRPDDSRSTRSDDAPSRRFSLESRILAVLGHTWRWLVFGLLSVGLFFLIRPITLSQSVALEEGKIPEDTIYSPVLLTVEDKVATEQYRQAAAENALPVFNQPVLPTPESFNNRLEQLFAAARMVASSTAVREATGTFDPLPSLRAEIEMNLSDGTLLTVYEHRDDRDFRNSVGRSVLDIQDQILGRGLVATEEGAKVLASASRGITVNRASRKDSIILTSTAGIIAQTELDSRINRRLDQTWPVSDPSDKPLNEAAKEIVGLFIKPTLYYDARATEEARESARAYVTDELVTYKQGEIIVEKGKPVTYRAALALNELAKTKQRTGAFLFNLGWMLLAILPVFALWGFLRRYEPNMFDDPRMVTVLAFIILLVAGWAKLAYLLELVLPTPILADLHYATPVAMAGILITVLANGWLGTLVVCLLAYLVGVMGDWSIKAVSICLLSGVVGAFSVARIHRRTALYRAGLWTGVAALLTVLGISFVENPTSLDLMANRQGFFFALTWAMVNALQSCAFASFLMVPLEAFLGVVTDIKLLEIGVKSDLLKELEEKAPGTYQHSLNVATLGETAAEAIGANSLLCRVGAYYHDIGKMDKPMYFTENQRTEQDRQRHEKLSPNMSCLIIRNHVKDGLERARKEKLPRAIQDFIAEHHGTTRIGFFYERAVSSSDHQSIAEEDFRYPGPKPQTVESAILMIADSIEATFRSLGPLTEGETMQNVRKIINDKFIDEQFEECPLTLRDLHRLSQAFTRALINMRHQRIEYPTLLRPIREPEALRVGRSPLI